MCDTYRAAPEERGEFGIIDNKILEKIGEKYSKTAAQVETVIDAPLIAHMFLA